MKSASPPGETARCQIAENEANDAAYKRGGDVAGGSQVITRTEEKRVLQGKGGKSGIPAAEPRHERSPQVRGFHEPVDAQGAENPHKQTAYEIDEQRVPGHIRFRDAPSGGDEYGRDVTQHAAHKAAAAHIHHCSERKFHNSAPHCSRQLLFFKPDAGQNAAVARIMLE